MGKKGKVGKKRRLVESEEEIPLVGAQGGEKKRKSGSGAEEDRKWRVKEAFSELGQVGEHSLEENFVPLRDEDKDFSREKEEGREASSVAAASGTEADVEDTTMPDTKEENEEQMKIDARKTNDQKKKGKGGSKKALITSKEGVIYLGHIPHGFYEEQMLGFFSQFGKVRQVRLSRSKKTGRSRGYAFIQFESNEVAKVVQKAMDKYILCDKLLVCELVKPENVHERMFIGADRKFKRISWRKVAAKQQNRPRTAEEEKDRLRTLKSRHKKQTSKLKAKGIEYELPNYF